MDQDWLTHARILIVDDTPANVLALEATLERGGYRNVRSTTRPQEALPLYRSFDPDLVLLDLHMPGIDGFTVLQEIKAICDAEEYRPVLVLTADTTEPTKHRALEAGAKDFLAKPLDLMEVQLRIRHLLETRCLYLQLQEQNRTLDQRVRERTRQVEEAQSRLLEAEQERKRFYCDVIRAVTDNKLCLIESDQLSTPGACARRISLAEPEGYALLRRALRDLGERVGMEGERIDDLVLAAGEAATNAIKHGEGGFAELYEDEDRIIARICDSGRGIQSENLAASLLMPGFSTKVSLGMGYTMMLRLVDRLWLSTGPEGTTVQVEKCLCPVPEAFELPLLVGVDDDW